MYSLMFLSKQPRPLHCSLLTETCCASSSSRVLNHCQTFANATVLLSCLSALCFSKLYFLYNICISKAMSRPSASSLESFYSLVWSSDSGVIWSPWQYPSPAFFFHLVHLQKPGKGCCLLFLLLSFRFLAVTGPSALLFIMKAQFFGFDFH